MTRYLATKDVELLWLLGFSIATPGFAVMSFAVWLSSRLLRIS